MIILYFWHPKIVFFPTATATLFLPFHPVHVLVVMLMFWLLILLNFSKHFIVHCRNSFSGWDISKCFYLEIYQSFNVHLLSLKESQDVQESFKHLQAWYDENVSCSWQQQFLRAVLQLHLVFLCFSKAPPSFSFLRVDYPGVISILKGQGQLSYL